MNKLTNTLAALGLAGILTTGGAYAAKDSSKVLTPSIKAHISELVSKGKGKTIDFFVSDAVVKQTVVDVLDTVKSGSPRYMALRYGDDESGNVAVQARRNIWYKLFERDMEKRYEDPLWALRFRIYNSVIGDTNCPEKPEIMRSNNEHLKKYHSPVEPEHMNNMTNVFGMMFNAVKSTVNDPKALTEFVKLKEDVVREVLSSYSQTSDGKDRLQALDKALSEMHKAILVINTDEFKKTRQKYLTAEKKYYCGSENQDQNLDTFLDVRRKLRKITPDLHMSMFAARRYEQVGMEAVKGLEKTTEYARNILKEYLK